MRQILFLMLGLPVVGLAQVADSSQRMVKLQGAVNCRDIGGYTGAEGKHVRWDKIYRSADISKLTESDLSVLQARHVSSVVDFRGTQESKQAPDKLNPGTDYILLPAGSDNTMGDWMKTIMAVKTESGGDSLMKVFYDKTEFLAARYKPFFEKLLALPDGQALLFHCTAGKDRTGIGAALLLYALGVPYDTIVADYTATNYYRASENERMVKGMVQGMHIAEPVARGMMGAKREYLETSFAAIRRDYGSIDAFLEGPVGLDASKRQALRNKFLE